MTSDPGLTCQDSDYATQIQETLDELQQMQEVPRVVTNPEALDAKATFEGAPIDSAASCSAFTFSTAWTPRTSKWHKTY